MIPRGTTGTGSGFNTPKPKGENMAFRRLSKDLAKSKTQAHNVGRGKYKAEKLPNFSKDGR